MELIDLSHVFSVKMPVFPGDERATLVEIATIKKDGYTNYQLRAGMHVGTHIDAPLHFIPEGKKISDFSLDRFYGSAKVVDARGKKEIDSDILKNVELVKDDIILFFTGHDQFYGKHDYFIDHPVLTEALAHKLIDVGIKMVGVDMASPDKYPFPLHKLFLENDILILENLTNLELLCGEDFELFAFPIKFETDAAFVRTIAKVE